MLFSKKTFYFNKQGRKSHLVGREDVMYPKKLVEGERRDMR